MLALTVEAAKNLAVVIVAVVVLFTVASAWLVRNVTAKVVTVLLLGGLALGVWTQRSALQGCADKVNANPTAGETCKFFGAEVRVPGLSTPR